MSTPSMDRICDGYILLDLQQRIQELNPAAMKLLGLKGPLVGLLLHEVLRPDWKRLLQDGFLAVGQCGHTVRFEAVSEHPGPLGVEFILVPNPDGVSVLLRDVTSVKNVEHTIQLNHQKLIQLIVDTNQIMYDSEPRRVLDSLLQELMEDLNLDVYFNYIYDTEAHKLRLMGYSGIREEQAVDLEWLVLGEAVCGSAALTQSRLVFENVHESDDPRVRLIRKLGIRSYACHPLVSYGRLIGTLSFGSRSRPSFTYHEIELMGTICQQIAVRLERALLITELKARNEELTLKSNAKTEFLIMMSHELRTPLNSILGFAQIMLDDPKHTLTEVQSDRMWKILNSSRHLNQIFNEFLNHPQMESGQFKLNPERVDLTELLADTILLIQPLAANKNLHIRNRLIRSVPIRIHCDPTRLKQVLLNLLTNAVKFNRAGGEIMVDCEFMETRLRLWIHDTGIGIPKEDIDQVFEPFYRIYHPEYNIEGTGIGLTIVKRFISLMGGEAGVESTPGSGSSFWITLPWSGPSS